MTAPDVSLVLNIHDEASYLHRTLRSCEEAVRYAAAAGVRVELVAVLDRAPSATRDWMAAWRSDAFAALRLVEVDNGSLAVSRNDGVRAAQGRWIATGDADDLISFNFIAEMAELAEQRGERVIVMPAYVAQFGASHDVVSYHDLKAITPLLFLQVHPYVSRIFAHRTVFAGLAYEDLGHSNGYAYEDWHFNCEALAAGYDFAVAPRTVLFYRRRVGSMLHEADRLSVRQIRPSRLFVPSVYRDICRDAAELLLAANPPLERATAPETIAADCSSFPDGALFGELTHAANAVDPAVDLDCLRQGGRWSPAMEGLQAGLLYFAACAGLTDQPYTDVFLLPFLAVGGAEKYLIQLMHALAAVHEPTRILLICGQPGAAIEWEGRLPPGSTVIDLWNLGVPASDEAVDLVTLKIIQAVGQGSRIHLKVCHYAHRFITRFNRVLAGHEIVYYHFSDTRYLADGRIHLSGAGFGFLSSNFGVVSLVITDSERMAAQDRDRFRVAGYKWACLPAYCEVSTTAAAAEARARVPHGRLIWASRIDREKRPDILLAIDEELARRGLDVAIDIYGGPVLNGIDPAVFAARSRLRYHGPFADFAAIDKEGADGFIYTTLFDGLPNVVLEAMAAGLPVIAPDCGGLAEVVRTGETGFLLADDPDEPRLARAYGDAIAALLADADRRVAMARNCLALIAERHSRAAHQARVAEIFRGIHGY